jgi:hypothetical protein
MIPVYEVDIDMEGWESGMTAISLVSRPAIQRSFVALSEQEEKPTTFKFADMDKKQLVGPIMVPEQLIYRKSERMGEYYIKFTAESIEKIMAKWSRDGFRAFNLEHSIGLGQDSVYILEYWIKEDDNDKSKKYGFDEPIGTAFVKLQVVSDLVWEDVKQNQLTGFSIEIDSNLIKTKEEMTENLKFAVEMGERFAKLEGEISGLKTTIEFLMSALEEKEIAEESATQELSEETVEETVEESVELSEETTEEVVEEPTAEEVIEEEVKLEEQETLVEEAELKLSEEQESQTSEEVVEAKTIEFKAITPEKINFINNFLGKPRY